MDCGHERRYLISKHFSYFSGVTDNQATLHEFVLLLERKTKGCQDEAEDVAASYPSLLAITARHGLINPMDRLIFNGAFSRSVGLWNFKPKFVIYYNLV